MLNLQHCLIFLSLFRGIKGDFFNNEEQGNIVSRPQTFSAEHNFGVSADGTVITDEGDEDSEKDEDLDDNRLETISVENLTLHEDTLNGPKEETNGTDTRERILQRKTREENFKPMQCFSCYASIEQFNTADGETCYNGVNVPLENCDIATQECYTEHHPLYIRRDCYDPKKLNVTHYCKCTLCNDKRADKPEYFTYDNIKDWKFQNKGLQIPNPPGVTPACKFCNATEPHPQSCLNGLIVDYTICNEKEVCFTSIDKHKGIVARGCAKKPVYNSFFHYCSGNKCNNEMHWDSDVIEQLYGHRSRLVSQAGLNVIITIEDAPLLFTSFMFALIFDNVLSKLIA